MPNETQEAKTVRTIADKGVWKTITEGITMYENDEGVFEFDPDEGFRVVLADPAKVALVSQTIEPSDFDAYDVTTPFKLGINANRLEDVLGEVGDAPVKLEFDFDDFMLKLRAGDVRYNFAGLDPESVRGSPTDIPPIDDDKAYDVRVNMPTETFKRAQKLSDMVTQIVTWEMEPDTFVFRGWGDTDDVSVDAVDTEGFEWIDEPETAHEARQSVDYMKDVASVLDEDTVELVTGTDLPYHLMTSRGPAGNRVVDTHIVQAPRIED